MTNQPKPFPNMWCELLWNRLYYIIEYIHIYVKVCNFKHGFIINIEVCSYIVPPSITPSITNETAIEGTSFTTPLTITGDPFPVSSNIVITRDGVSVQDGRITVNIGSGIGTSSFTMENVNRTDSGSYTVNVTTTAGSDTAVVNLDVYCELVFFVFYIKSIQYIFPF